MRYGTIKKVQVHFQEDVEERVQSDGDQKALGQFFVLEFELFFEREQRRDFVEDGPALFLAFVLQDRTGKLGQAVIVAQDPGEHDVGEGGKKRAENKRVEEVFRAAAAHDVHEINDVFDEGEAERGGDEHFDGVVDGADVLFVAAEFYRDEFGGTSSITPTIKNVNRTSSGMAVMLVKPTKSSLNWLV